MMEEILHEYNGCHLFSADKQWGPAKLGLYYAQAVSRFDGESKSCTTVH